MVVRKMQVNDLLATFRTVRQQVLDDSKTSDAIRQHSNRKKSMSVGDTRSKPSPYRDFYEKYTSGDSYVVDDFSLYELALYFCEKARESGNRYEILNKARDLAIFKRLKSHYSNAEICLMVEFLFSNDQDYLTKADLKPTILASTWWNTIYNDSISWANDEPIHTARVSTKAKTKPAREWDYSKKDGSQIGEW